MNILCLCTINETYKLIKRGVSASILIYIIVYATTFVPWDHSCTAVESQGQDSEPVGQPGRCGKRLSEGWHNGFVIADPQEGIYDGIDRCVGSRVLHVPPRAVFSPAERTATV